MLIGIHFCKISCQSLPLVMPLLWSEITYLRAVFWWNIGFFVIEIADILSQYRSVSSVCISPKSSSTNLNQITCVVVLEVETYSTSTVIVPLWSPQNYPTFKTKCIARGTPVIISTPCPVCITKSNKCCWLISNVFNTIA